MSDDPIRIAIIGCGTIAPTHAKAIAELADSDVRMVACCDIDAGRAKAFAADYSVPAMTLNEVLAAPNIDAVSICTPSGLHSTIGVACLRAGKHTVVEKPLDITLEACDRLIAAQRAGGKTLACISQHRYDPASVFVKEAIDRGDLGPLFMSEARVTWYRTQDYYDSGQWRGTFNLDGGGCLMNQGVHTVDLMLWLCGPATSVYAQARTAGHDRIEVEDAIAATVTFANGAIGTITASTAAYPGFPVRLAVHGTHGSAVLEGDSLQTLAVMGRETISGPAPADHAKGIASGGTRSMATAASAAIPAASEDRAPDGEIDAFPLAPPTWGDAHRAQLAEFFHCCRTGKQPKVDGLEGRSAVELILAIYKSARSGEAVRLPLIEP